MSVSYPEMKSIRELNGLKFVIPSYQRGFRWTKQQIKELIDDLYEFSNNNSREKYCLQNIVVQSTGKENEFYVIDGQQRLTAIWLFMMVGIGFSREACNYPLYTLKYIDKKDFSESVDSIHKTINDRLECLRNAEQEEQPTIYPKGICEVIKNKDIDSQYLSNATKFIGEYKDHNGIHGYRIIESYIFNDKLLSISPSKQICFIWNELPVNVNDSKSTGAAIEKFSNINANKIPLTESELIKAYIINGVKPDKVDEVSHQWESMERGLSNNSFWAFISGEEEETRMDFLFRVWINAKGLAEDSTDKHFLSRKFYEQIQNGENAYSVWATIVRIYSTLCDWYDDYYFYHMIGLIIAIDDKKTSKVVSDLYKKYQNTTKDSFKSLLRKVIRTMSCYKMSFDIQGQDDAREWNIGKWDDISVGNESLSYDKNKNNVKAMLLLFNIALLVNAYNVNQQNSLERFPFEAYKSKENPVEIEHINPKHLEGKSPSGKEYTEKEKKEWAIKTLDIIPDEKKENLKKLIDGAEWSQIIGLIEEKADLNSLNNLTLLDKKLNISYGDNFFAEKRKYILAARFGLTDPKNNEQKHSVIFPGTMWVFLRQYIEHDESNSADDRWNAFDRDHYEEAIQKSVYELLKDEKKEGDSNE